VPFLQQEGNGCVTEGVDGVETTARAVEMDDARHPANGRHIEGDNHGGDRFEALHGREALGAVAGEQETERGALGGRGDRCGHLQEERVFVREVGVAEGDDPHTKAIQETVTEVLVRGAPAASQQRTLKAVAVRFHAWQVATNAAP